MNAPKKITISTSYNMKKSFWIILFSLFSVISFGQKNCDCYERLYNLAWYYYSLNQFSEGLSAMKLAMNYKKESASKTDYIVLAFLYSKNDSLDQAASALMKSIERGLDFKSVDSEEIQAFKNKIGEERWQRIEANNEQLGNKYKSTLNIDYRLGVEWLKGSDQRVRSTKDGRLCEEYIVLFDSLNFRDLKKLFAKYGFPKMEKDGFEWGTIDAFMMHYSLKSRESFNEVLDIQEEANMVCACNRGNIALITDRYRRWIEQSPQLYGVWNLWQEKGVFGEIENVAEVDSRRFGHNLLRLKEQSKMENRELPVGYVFGEYPDGYFCGLQFVE